MKRRLFALNGALLIAVAVIAYFALSSLFHKASAHAAQRTATATLGTVAQTVSASGNISSAQSQNLNFASAGTVTQIDVTVGQQVAAGQVLASIDPAPAQAALTAAQDQLTAARDNLSLAQSGGETPPQIAQDDATLSADQQAVDQDQAALTATQNQLSADQASCAGSSSATASASATGTGSTTSVPTGPCAAVTTDNQTITQEQQSLTQAQNALSQEQLSLNTKRYVNPASVLQDQAAITTAQETVTQDQKTLAQTNLVAPFSGTITALNAAVGSAVSGGGASAASSANSGGSSASGASAASSSSSSSSSAFLTLADLSNLQVTAGFPEAQAIKVKVGQSATVTLSALSGVSVPATVTAISPVPTVVSNVVTYQVTVGLTNPPATVQDGMSTTMSVVVASASDTLEVPSSAVTTTGRVSTVNLLRNGKTVLTTVTTGIVGNSTTQILSGLSAGDVIVEPSVTVSAGTSTGTTGFGGATRTGGLGGGLGGFGGAFTNIGGG